MRVGQGEHTVTNWIWHEGKFEPGIKFASPGQAGPHPADCEGHFAVHHEPRPGEHLLARDRMGVNKLFFVIDVEGQVHSSNFLVDLLRAGFEASAIHSVPSGHTVHIVPDRELLELAPHSQLRFEDGGEPGGDEIVTFARTVRASLDATFERLATALRGRRVFVTLSGGLDSTTIAVLARRWLNNVTAVTFYIDDESKGNDPCEDLASARRVAEEIDMPLELVAVTPEQLMSYIDPVLIWGQDWRDFNVHCGLVNASIGAALHDRHFSSRAAGTPTSRKEARPVILTGDTMNELMADYVPESYRGREYYSLPRLPAARLRRFLVDGLDSGDREVGIFAHYGFDTLQPYALSASAYAAFPGRYLGAHMVKQELAQAVMGDEVPAHVYDRPKVRAQVGSSVGVDGTLAVVADRNFGSQRLAQRFVELLRLTDDDLGSLIRGGFYRFTAQYSSVLSEAVSTLEMETE